MYHISDLKKFTKCPKLYLFDRESENVFKPYLRSDESFTDLLKEKLKIENCFTGQVGDSNDAFVENKDKFEWFLKTRFEINELRIKIPAMHKLNDCFDLYFAYYGTTLKELDLFSYRISLEVIEKLGLKINKIYLAYINPDYVFHDRIDPDELFIIESKYKDSEIIDIVENDFVDYEAIINKIKVSTLDNTIPIKTRACHIHGVCPHLYKCFPNEEKLDDDSVLTLVSSANKTKMYDNGIVHLKDIDISKIEGNRVQYAQIKASMNGGLFVDKCCLEMFLDKIKTRPLSFVDFEWDRYLIPKYEGMKPLDVMPFEFALYVDNGQGDLEHKTFVSSGDCRKEFIETLLEALPKEGKILAYNATGAEILRLKELARLYPEYEEKIEEVVSRFVDLAVPFIEGIVYDTRMAGDFSLKKLVSIVSDKTYKDLNVTNGLDAVFSWRDIDKGQDKNEDEAINDLKEYCLLDAYGLYLVYKWLLKIV